MKKVIFRAMIFAVCSVGLVSCTSGNANESKSAVAEEVNIPLVKVMKATVEPIDQLIEFSGNIEPFVKNNISSSSAQRIEEICVEVGDQVRRGQTLVKMESINYEQQRIQFENLKVDLARTEQLLKSGGVSQQAYDQLKAQVDVVEESINNLKKNTILSSPIDGVITQRNFDSGDLTMGQPILTVMQLRPVKILINISEEFFPSVSVGTPVKVMLDVYGGEEFNGEISLIYPTIDATTRTFQAQVKIKNDNMKIRPGMFARVKVDFGKHDRVVIPDQAVIKQNGTNNRYVYVLNPDNTVSFRLVELGIRNGAKYEVISGVERDESVVTAGQARLLDKMKVEVDKSMTNF